MLRDCAKAIELNSHASKAYYRAAQALLALDRPKEAVDGCRRCLNFDTENAPMKALADRAEKALKEKEEKERKEKGKRKERKEGKKRRPQGEDGRPRFQRPPKISGQEDIWFLQA